MIKIDNISAAYPGHTVLESVTLHCEPGQHIAILGSNGSGKSTLLKTITALGGISAGTVSVDDVNPYLLQNTNTVRAMVGFVQQRPDDQIVATTVLDDVAFGPENLGLSREEILERCTNSLAQVSLTGFENREPHTLSGGQKQRLAIAGVLAMRPRYILFDEPTSMLDPQGHDEIMAHIVELAKAGVGVVHVTHEVADTVEADQIIVLHKKKIAFSGTHAQLLSCGEQLEQWGIDPTIVPLGEHPFADESGDATFDSPRELGEPTVPSAHSASESEDATFDSPREHHPLGCGEGCCGASQVASPALAGITNVLSDRTNTPDSPTQVLATRQVSARYELGDQVTEALRDVSVTIPSPGLTVIVGHTGSGKSTLLKILAGLSVPSDGEVSLDGEPLTAKSARGKVGLIFQDAESALFADTVIEDVMFGPKNFGFSAEKALVISRKTLASINLDPDVYGDRSPFQLSGGEARRVAIAGILAFAPSFILADEPTAGLDAPARLCVRKALYDASRRCGVVVVTHKPEEFIGVACQVIKLVNGEVHRG